MKKYYFILIITGFLTAKSFSQVGINNTEFLPDAAAMMDIRAGDSADPKGLLIPRLDATMEANLLNKVQNENGEMTDGLMYYSLSKKKFMYYHLELNQVFEINPWTVSVDENSVYLEQNVGIGTDSPDPLYKLDIQGGDVNIANSLDVKENVHIDHDLELEGDFELNGDITLNNETQINGEIKAKNGIVVQENQEFRYSTPRTRILTISPSDFAFFPSNGIPAENIHHSFYGVLNMTEPSNDDSPEKIFGVSYLDLPDKAIIKELSAEFSMNIETTLDANIAIYPAESNPTWIVGATTSGNGFQTISKTYNYTVDISNSKEYRIKVEIPGKCRLMKVQVKYEVRQVD